jgi:hypothetical protein
MESESLQPLIDEAQKALGMALDEACAVDAEEVDTGELIRIEESLALAIKAAKEAVSLRLRRRNQRAAAAGQPQSKSEPAEESPTAAHRIFDDIRGKRWHAFAVHPSSATVGRAALPESFRQGWLVFESIDEMRRVAPIPDKWQELSIDDLRLLCHKAGAAPKRAKDAQPTMPPPPPPKPPLDPKHNADS